MLSTHEFDKPILTGRLNPSRPTGEGTVVAGVPEHLVQGLVKNSSSFELFRPKFGKPFLSILSVLPLPSPPFLTRRFGKLRPSAFAADLDLAGETTTGSLQKEQVPKGLAQQPQFPHSTFCCDLVKSLSAAFTSSSVALAGEGSAGVLQKLQTPPRLAQHPHDVHFTFSCGLRMGLCDSSLKACVADSSLTSFKPEAVVQEGSRVVDSHAGTALGESSAGVLQK